MHESQGPPLITLLTDFGTCDGYAAVMKGVIAGICPMARVIDLSHDVPPQEISSASFLIERSYRYFPEGTIHVVVVDPGVGSERAGLGLEFRGHLFVGPDNGIFTPFFSDGRVHRLNNPQLWRDTVSHTFHGRDVFAPIAAWLASGTRLDQLGPELIHAVQIESRSPQPTARGWRGEVVYIDRFGNLITSFSSDFLKETDLELFEGPEKGFIQIEDGPEWPIVRTYSKVGFGEQCAVMGGFDHLEMAVNQGNAREVSGAKIGTALELILSSED